MKKILLFFVFAGTFSFAQVQEKNQIGASYQIGYSSMSYQKSTANPGFSKLIDSLQTNGLTQGVAVSYVRRLNRELTLVSGLQIQALRFNFLANSLPSLNIYQQRLDYATVPLGLEYNFITDTWQPFVGFTIAASYLMRSHIAYVPQLGWNEIQTSTYRPNSSLLLNAVFNVGAQLPVTLKWSVKPSIICTYGLNSIGTSMVPQRPLQIAFQAAVLYNF